MIKSPDLSATIWERISPFLKARWWFTRVTCKGNWYFRRWQKVRRFRTWFRGCWSVYLGNLVRVPGGPPILTVCGGCANMFPVCWVDLTPNNLVGGHFGPHYDGWYTKNSNERSMKTFMLWEIVVSSLKISRYLNSGFEGGATRFIDDSQNLHKDAEGRYCAEEVLLADLLLTLIRKMSFFLCRLY